MTANRCQTKRPLKSRMVLSSIAFLLSLTLSAQTSNQIFQIDGKRNILSFDENAGSLSNAVKSAIQDDINLIFRQNPVSNAVVRTFKSDRGLGFDGNIVWKHPFYPRHFAYGSCLAFDNRFGRYKRFNGTNVFQVGTELIRDYEAAIRITNHFRRAVSQLPDFLRLIDGLSPQSISVEEFAGRWWSLRTMQAISLTNMPGCGSEHDARGFANDVLAEYSGLTCSTPSVLDFTYEPIRPNQSVCCIVRTRRKAGGDFGPEIPLIWVQDEWHFLSTDIRKD